MSQKSRLLIITPSTQDDGKDFTGPMQCSYGRGLILCVTLTLVFILYWSTPSWLWCHRVDSNGLCATQESLEPLHEAQHALVFSNFMAEYKEHLRISKKSYSRKHTCTSPPSVYNHQLGDGEQDQSEVLCRPLMPLGARCGLRMLRTAEDGPPAKCTISQHNICRFERKSDTPSVHDIECDQDICDGRISLGIETRKNDGLQWRSFPGITELEHGLLELLVPLAMDSEYIRFCVITCLARKSVLSIKHAGTISQLLYLPPLGNMREEKHDLEGKERNADFKHFDGRVNINIVSLSALSRSQFFHSLPKTVLALKETNTPSSAAVALDFELNQSFNPAVTLKDLLLRKVLQVSGFASHGLFKTAKDLDYRMVWLEELCWNTQTGTLNDIGSNLHESGTNTSERLKLIKDAFFQAGVDDLGPSLTRCLLGEHTGASTPTCFTDQEYLLEYGHRYSQHMNPYLSVFTSHAVPSYNLDAFDETLAKHVNLFASLDNTMTILTSESFKTGDDPQNIHKEHLDFPNPALFIIMPKSVQTLLGTRRLNSLIHNQNRLVTFEDLHQTLQALLRMRGSNGPKRSSFGEGLLSFISANRTCMDLMDNYRVTSATCLCQDQEMPSARQPHDALITEFALGELNELMRYQAETEKRVTRKLTKDELKKRCPQLVANGFENITRAYGNDGFVTVRLDILIEPGTLTAHKSSRDHLESASKHVIRVAVRYLSDPDHVSGSLQMELVSYARTSPHPMTNMCSNQGGNTSELCICGPSTNYKSSRGILLNHFLRTNQKYRPTANLTTFNDAEWLLSNPPVVFNVTSTIQSADPNGKVQCLYVAYRTHAAGSCFELLNICDNRVYFVVFDLNGVNFTFSGELPVSLQVAPQSRRYVTVALQKGEQSYWKYSVQFSFDYLE